MNKLLYLTGIAVAVLLFAVACGASPATLTVIDQPTPDPTRNDFAVAAAMRMAVYNGNEDLSAQLQQFDDVWVINFADHVCEAATAADSETGLLDALDGTGLSRSDTAIMVGAALGARCPDALDRLG